MYFDNKSLLRPPVSRAAYSDRSAWLMAEMSRLAYFKFEGGIELKDLADKLSEETSPKSILSMLDQLLGDNQVSKSVAQSKLDEYLAVSDFKLIAIFNADGSQAFLASSDKYRMNVLVFRGTEADLSDIKADLKATTIDIEGSQIHSGFYTAFCSIKEDIENALEVVASNRYPLYIQAIRWVVQ
jgi:triacylglycerol lipase